MGFKSIESSSRGLGICSSEIDMNLREKNNDILFKNFRLVLNGR